MNKYLTVCGIISPKKSFFMISFMKFKRMDFLQIILQSLTPRRFRASSATLSSYRFRGLSFGLLPSILLLGTLVSSILTTWPADLNLSSLMNWIFLIRLTEMPALQSYLTSVHSMFQMRMHCWIRNNRVYQGEFVDLSLNSFFERPFLTLSSALSLLSSVIGYHDLPQGCSGY